jgi:hypothetical protein
MVQIVKVQYFDVRDQNLSIDQSQIRASDKVTVQWDTIQRDLDWHTIPKVILDLFPLVNQRPMIPEAAG